jgi:hypothetical protein
MEVGFNMRLPRKTFFNESEEQLVKNNDTSDRDLTCSLNYEAEYHRLMEEFQKLKADRDYLYEELKVMDRDARWNHGFRAAVEIIFGRAHNYG